MRRRPSAEETEEKMIEIGRLCIKIAGRDAGMKCVVVDILDRNFVLIDGETRRKRCNILHLEPTPKVVGISKGASQADIASVLLAEGIEARSTKPKQPQKKPVAKRKSNKASQRKEQSKKEQNQQKPQKKSAVKDSLEEKAEPIAPAGNQEKPAKKSMKKIAAE